MQVIVPKKDLQDSQVKDGWLLENRRMTIIPRLKRASLAGIFEYAAHVHQIPNMRSQKTTTIIVGFFEKKNNDSCYYSREKITK